MSPPATSRAEARVSAVAPRAADAWRDELWDVGWFLAPFAGYVVLDLGTRLLSRVEPDRVGEPVLLAEAIRSQPLAYVGAAVGIGVLAWSSRSRLLARWTELDRGRLLRWVVGPGILVLTWQGALHDYNFALQQGHLVDRALIVALGLASLIYPVFLGIFAAQVRVLNVQFFQPFGTSSAQNIDEMVVTALLAVAAIHLLYVVTGRNDSSAALPLVGAAIAAHYFVPGRTKLMAGWLATNDIANVPLGSYTAGWLGHTDGGWALNAFSFLSTFTVPALIGTLVVELGSLLATAHHRILRLWLPGAILFHIGLFALTGFWFLSWIAVEMALLVVLWNGKVSRWLGASWTPARGLATVAVVGLVGGLIFHPPPLTWLDAPVSYGYRITVGGESGTAYMVPASNFSPMEQELMFRHMPLGARSPLSGGYGYVGTDSDEYERLQDLRTIDEVLAMEGSREVQDEESVRFLEAFARYANDGGPDSWASLSPPDHFWSSTPEPVYRFQEPITRLDVVLVTSLHRSGDPVRRDDTLLSLAVAPDGQTTALRDG